MVFVETPFYQAWKQYADTIEHRFYQYAHAVFIVLMYEILMAIFQTNKAIVYNGVDAWYFVTEKLLRGGTFMISLVVIVVWGFKLYQDWFGVKDRKEYLKDRSESKKRGKGWKPKAKTPFSKLINPYYFFFIIFEGFVWGSLIFWAFGDILYLLLSALIPDLTIPLSLDASRALRPLHTNLGQDIAFAFGAGFYDEYFFRSLLFVGLAWLAKRFPLFKSLSIENVKVGNVNISMPKYKGRDSGFISVIVVGTLIYVLTHYLLPGGDIFSVYSTFYRFFFGIFMYLIFVNRRFAVVAWTHVIYDLWYFLTL